MKNDLGRVAPYTVNWKLSSKLELTSSFPNISLHQLQSDTNHRSNSGKVKLANFLQLS